VIPKPGKRWTFTDILWERVPDGGNRNTKARELSERLWCWNV